jgi:hypothetical protein
MTADGKAAAETAKNERKGTINTEEKAIFVACSAVLEIVR